MLLVGLWMGVQVMGREGGVDVTRMDGIMRWDGLMGRMWLRGVVRLMKPG